MSALSELGKLRGRGKDETPDNVAGYLFLLPWLIGLVLITIGPMLGSSPSSPTRKASSSWFVTRHISPERI